MKFHSAKPRLVCLLYLVFVAQGAQYLVMYLTTEPRKSPFIMAAILLFVAIIPIWCHRVLAKTRIMIEGNTVTQFEVNGKIRSKIVIDDNTVATLN